MYQTWKDSRVAPDGSRVEVTRFIATGTLFRNPERGDNLRACGPDNAVRRVNISVGPNAATGKYEYITAFARPGREGQDVNIQKLDSCQHMARLALRGRVVSCEDRRPGYEGRMQDVLYIDFVEVLHRGQAYRPMEAAEGEGALPEPGAVPAPAPF